MKIDRNTNYWTKGSTKEQREEFIKLILEDGPRGCGEEVVTDFIFECLVYNENDCVYFSDGEWLWYFQGNSEYTCNMDIKDMFITRFEYIDENGRNIVAYGNFSFQLQDGGRILKVFKEVGIN